MKKNIYSLTIILLILLMGCERMASTSEIQIPSPEPEKAIIHGRLLSPTDEPLNDVTVRLAQVYRFDDGEGTFILDEAQSPSTISQQDGQYIFINISPGEYVLFIGKLHSDYKIVAETDDVPIVYEVGPGEVLKIETVIVDFD